MFISSLLLKLSMKSQDEPYLGFRQSEYFEICMNACMLSHILHAHSKMLFNLSTGSSLRLQPHNPNVYNFLLSFTNVEWKKMNQDETAVIRRFILDMLKLHLSKLIVQYKVYKIIFENRKKSLQIFFYVNHSISSPPLTPNSSMEICYIW